MKVGCVIATHGAEEWSELAWSRAYPSTLGQGFADVIVWHETAATLADARNAAARALPYEALVFLDADDELAPGYLTAMAPLLHGRAVIEFTPIIPGVVDPYAAAFPSEIDVTDRLPPTLGVPAVSYVHPNGFEEKPQIPNRGRWPFLNEAVIGTLVSRQLFLNVGGFRDIPMYEDWDLWLRCVDAGAVLQYVEGAVYRAHVRPGSRNQADGRKMYAEVWGAHLQRIGQAVDL